MSNKKILAFTLFLITSFLTPLLVFSFFASSPMELGEAYKSMWAEGMTSYINKETLNIIINNLMVLAIMFLFSIIPFTIYNKGDRKEQDFKKVVWLVTIAYCMYFIKEGIRAGLGLLDFPYATYWFGVFILTLPHGIIEITGFALGSAVILQYYESKISKNIVFKYVLLCVVLILLAGIIETTLTPYLFRKFI